MECQQPPVPTSSSEMSRIRVRTSSDIGVAPTAARATWISSRAPSFHSLVGLRNRSALVIRHSKVASFLRVDLRQRLRALFSEERICFPTHGERPCFARNSPISSVAADGKEAVSCIRPKPTTVAAELWEFAQTPRLTGTGK